MTEAYLEYLNSAAWQLKRHQRLDIDGYRCVICGFSNAVDIHHITYARLFKENVQDLMTLCRKHHEAIEGFIKDGMISRVGDVHDLARYTRDLLSPHRKVKEVESQPYQYSKKVIIEVRNPKQELLMSEDWFKNALRLRRKDFSRIVREHFKGVKRKGPMMANCFALFDRLKRTNRA